MASKMTDWLWCAVGDSKGSSSCDHDWTPRPTVATHPPRAHRECLNCGRIESRLGRYYDSSPFTFAPRS